MCPSLANFAGGTTPRVVHSGQTVYGLLATPADVLSSRNGSNDTKWGNLQDFCADTRKEFFEVARGSKTKKPRKVVTHITRIGGIGHDFEPALKGGDLKEGKVGPADIVKLHLRVTPLCLILLQASRNVWDDFWIDRQAGSYVKALKLGEEEN